MSNTEQTFGGRMGREAGGFRERGPAGENDGYAGQDGSQQRFNRQDVRQLPDSLRARFGAREGRQGGRSRNFPDSLRQSIPGNDLGQGERGQFEVGMRNGQGRRSGEFTAGKKINLGNVVWFLSVFASFTVIAVYLLKWYSMIRKRVNGGISPEN